MKAMVRLCALVAGSAACAGPAVPTKSAVVSTLPSASPPAPAPASAAAGGVASPFQVIGELAGDFQLFGAGSRGFVLSHGGVELELSGDDVVQDPLFKRGVPVGYGMITVEAIAGRWPDALWLSTTEPSGRSGFSTVWSWDGKNWSRKQRTNDNQFVVGIQEWTGGRMLALKQAGMAFDASFALLSGDSHVTLPVFDKVTSSDEFSMCMTSLKVDAWSALPSGEVVALGERCDVTDDFPLAVERWAPGAKKGTLETLPEAQAAAGRVAWSDAALAALSPNDIFVAASKEVPVREHEPWQRSDYFAHFDGKSWQRLASPIPEGVKNLWVQADGALFASNRKDELWSRSTKGEWSAVAWPEQLPDKQSLKLASLWPHAPGDVWAIVSGASATAAHSYLLHTRAAPHPMPTPEAMAKREREYSLPGPPVDWCTTPFVLLYTLGRKSPADYDYPATREALKGHPEFAESKFVEFERDGRRFFGARVADFKLGKKLAQLVKDKVVGSTPQLACHDPAETRELVLDLRTAKLQK